MTLDLRSLVLPRLRSLAISNSFGRAIAAGILCGVVLASGLLAFAIADAALAMAVETRHRGMVRPRVRPSAASFTRAESRSGEPTARARGGEKLRVQQGIDPAAMGFEDEPGEPLVFNFGYRGRFPDRRGTECLSRSRCGGAARLRPDPVLSVHALGGSYAAVVLRKWVNRLSFDDVPWMWKSGFL